MLSTLTDVVAGCQINEFLAQLPVSVESTQLVQANPKRFAIGFIGSSIGAVAVSTNPAVDSTWGQNVVQTALEWFWLDKHGSMPCLAWYCQGVGASATVRVIEVILTGG